ncbi:Na+/H+ antiporter subunit D [Salinibius halmophilus]|uniref:Na+/H+ antiporter subunit D n=1 Tax=Salinibius halmophilus TaxID=1853216 RepID=UPI000E66EC45|nr:Na+/H+ antiporter subunit D [Salinibius halmophilus]
MNNLVFLPILIPLLAGAITLALWRSSKWQKRVSVFATLLYLTASATLAWQVSQQGYIVLQVGGWQAPFGISLVADYLASIMVVVTGIVAFTAVLYSLVTTPNTHIKFGYFPLLHILLAGVSGAFLTGDLFNLFVWFEVMLLASFGLLTLGGERAQMEGAIKYVTINLFSSALFLSAIGILYGTVGTLNMADLAVKLQDVEQQGLLNAIALMFMVSFSIKAGAFPFFFWLPASYHTPIIAVSAVFAGLLTKVGVYALYRVFGLIFIGDINFTHQILLWMGVFTMLSGVLGAASQFEIRRILSFHIISQIGYMILALAIFTPLAIAGGVFYLFHHIIVKTNLFLISGMTHLLQNTYQLKSMGGLYRERPFLAALFLIPAMSLAGLPPLSGFFAKYLVIEAGIVSQQWLATGVALFVGLLTLYSMIKIWAEAFWKAKPETLSETVKLPLWGVVPIALMAIMTLIIGFAAEPFILLSQATAEQLLNPQSYINAVLGGQP